MTLAPNRVPVKLYRDGCACESPDCQPVDCAWATLAGCNLLQDALAVSGVARLRLLHVDGVGEVVNHDGIGHEGAVGARSADEHHHGLVLLERCAELDKTLHGVWQESTQVKPLGSVQARGEGVEASRRTQTR